MKTSKLFMLGCNHRPLLSGYGIVAYVLTTSLLHESSWSWDATASPTSISTVQLFYTPPNFGM